MSVPPDSPHVLTFQPLLCEQAKSVVAGGLAVAVEPVINLEELLAPISGENPAGENLLYSGLHDDVREARRAEEALDQGEWKREIKTSDWPKVVDLSAKALGSKTKDLQVCAWLGEALVRLYGFAGLRDSLRLMRGLLENFWDKVYPEIDGGDLEARANAVAFLDRQAARAIKDVPITKAASSSDCSYVDWEDAKRFDIPESLEGLSSEQIERVNQLKEQAEREGRTTSERFRIAKNATRRSFYEETFALLSECWDEYKALDKVMDEKFLNQTPGLGGLRKSLDEVRTLVERFVKEKRVLEPDIGEARAAEGEPAVQEAPETPAAAFGSSAGPIRTRADALRRLTEVSDYFKRTEPHSPVSYLVQRAIKWGQMPLELWLEDVIKDGNVLAQLRETLGIKTSPDPAGQGP